MRFHTGAALLLLFLAATTSLYAQAAQPAALHACAADPAYHKFDFWVGKWDVYDNHDGTLNGTDVVEKIVGGCALVESWQEADRSGEGQSLFYYQQARKQWKQVWVTDTGTIKEKQLIEELKDGGMRFQGEILHPDGKTHLDRTTLTPLAGGRVHQVIEISGMRAKPGK